MEYKNSAEKMIREGWCKNCDGKPARCLRQGKCLGDAENKKKKFLEIGLQKNNFVI